MFVFLIKALVPFPRSASVPHSISGTMMQRCATFYFGNDDAAVCHILFRERCSSVPHSISGTMQQCATFYFGNDDAAVCHILFRERWGPAAFNYWTKERIDIRGNETRCERKLVNELCCKIHNRILLSFIKKILFDLFIKKPPCTQRLH